SGWFISSIRICSLNSCFVQVLLLNSLQSQSLECYIDIFDIIICIGKLCQFTARKIFGDFNITAERFQQSWPSNGTSAGHLPHFFCVTLYHLIGFLAFHTFVDERQENPL